MVSDCGKEKFPWWREKTTLTRLDPGKGCLLGGKRLGLGFLNTKRMYIWVLLVWVHLPFSYHGFLFSRGPTCLGCGAKAVISFARTSLVSSASSGHFFCSLIFIWLNPQDCKRCLFLPPPLSRICFLPWAPLEISSTYPQGFCWCPRFPLCRSPPLPSLGAQGHEGLFG